MSWKAVAIWSPRRARQRTGLVWSGAVEKSQELDYPVSICSCRPRCEEFVRWARIFRAVVRWLGWYRLAGKSSVVDSYASLCRHRREWGASPQVGRSTASVAQSLRAPGATPHGSTNCVHQKDPPEGCFRRALRSVLQILWFVSLNQYRRLS